MLRSWRVEHFLVHKFIALVSHDVKYKSGPYIFGNTGKVKIKTLQSCWIKICNFEHDQ